MNEITVQFDVSDEDLKQAILDEFGPDVELVKVTGFDGLTSVLEVVLPIVPPLVTLLINFFTAKRKQNEGRRVAIVERREISLEGYSGDEIERFLKKLQETE